MTPAQQKKQDERKLKFFTDGVPKYVRCYDNGGHEREGGTIDRYTIVLTGRYTHKTGGAFWYLTSNANPFHPQGFGQHGETMHTPCDRPTYGHLGKKIKYADLPDAVKEFVMDNYLYIWDFTDEDGKEVAYVPSRTRR